MRDDETNLRSRYAQILIDVRSGGNTVAGAQQDDMIGSRRAETWRAREGLRRVVLELGFDSEIKAKTGLQNAMVLPVYMAPLRTEGCYSLLY